MLFYCMYNTCVIIKKICWKYDYDTFQLNVRFSIHIGIHAVQLCVHSVLLLETFNEKQFNLKMRTMHFLSAKHA